MSGKSRGRKRKFAFLEAIAPDPNDLSDAAVSVREQLEAVDEQFLVDWLTERNRRVPNRDVAIAVIERDFADQVSSLLVLWEEYLVSRDSRAGSESGPRNEAAVGEAGAGRERAGAGNAGESGNRPEGEAGSESKASIAGERVSDIGGEDSAKNAQDSSGDIRAYSSPSMDQQKSRDGGHFVSSGAAHPGADSSGHSSSDSRVDSRPHSSVQSETTPLPSDALSTPSVSARGTMRVPATGSSALHGASLSGYAAKGDSLEGDMAGSPPSLGSPGPATIVHIAGYERPLEIPHADDEPVMALRHWEQPEDLQQFLQARALWWRDHRWSDIHPEPVNRTVRVYVEMQRWLRRMTRDLNWPTYKVVNLALEVTAYLLASGHPLPGFGFDLNMQPVGVLAILGVGEKRSYEADLGFGMMQYLLPYMEYWKRIAGAVGGVSHAVNLSINTLAVIFYGADQVMKSDV